MHGIKRATPRGMTRRLLAITCLAAGPMPAWTEPDRAAVWVQTQGPAEVAIAYVAVGSEEPRSYTPCLKTRVEDDCIAQFVLDDLEPGNRYAYQIVLDGRIVARPDPYYLHTQPRASDPARPPEFVAMLGSCAYINDPARDRPGESKGSDFEIFSAMAKTPCDFMLWLGDNVYFRGDDAETVAGLWARFRHTRSFPMLQPFLASTHHYATWDDNDYGPDNADGSYALKLDSKHVFESYWPAVHYGPTDAIDGRPQPGIYQHFTYGDAEFFLLDDRSFRSDAGPQPTMLGDAQLEWLEASLLASQARFKVVACGNQVVNPISQYESMALFPNDRDAIFDWIRTQHIEGVFFVTGDRHRSELIRLDLPGLYPLYDFTSSSLTAPTHEFPPGDPEANNPSRVQGTLLNEHSYGLLRFQGSAAERQVSMVGCDKIGRERWTVAVKASDLVFAP